MAVYDEIINELKPILKIKGYKKNGVLWIKENEKLYILVKIYRSLYGGNSQLYLGIIIKDIRKKTDKLSMTHYHLLEQVVCDDEDGQFISLNKIVSIIDMWEKWYGDFDNLHKLALKDRLPFNTKYEAKKFLTSFL